MDPAAALGSARWTLATGSFASASWLSLELGMEVMTMADRRAGKGPYVRDEGGGKQPRSRNQDGTWRKKRSDAGTQRRASAKGKK